MSPRTLTSNQFRSIQINSNQINSNQFRSICATQNVAQNNFKEGRLSTMDSPTYKLHGFIPCMGSLVAFSYILELHKLHRVTLLVRYVARVALSSDELGWVAWTIWVAFDCSDIVHCPGPVVIVMTINVVWGWVSNWDLDSGFMGRTNPINWQNLRRWYWTTNYKIESLPKTIPIPIPIYGVFMKSNCL